MNRKKLLLLLLFLPLSQSFGQNFLKDYIHKKREQKQDRYANEQIWKSNLIGLSQQNSQNLVFSPLLYAGFGVSQLSTRTNLYKNRINTFRSEISANALAAANAKSVFFGINAAVFYGKLKKINDNLAVGGEAGFLLYSRINPDFQNNALQLESILNFSPKVIYQTKITRKIDAEFQLSVPVVGLSMLTPKYAFSFDGIETKLNAFHNSFMPRTSILLTLPPNKRFKNNRYQIGYQWQMLRINRGNQNTLTTGIHSLYFIGNISKIK